MLQGPEQKNIEIVRIKLRRLPSKASMQQILAKCFILLVRLYNDCMRLLISHLVSAAYYVSSAFPLSRPFFFHSALFLWLLGSSILALKLSEGLRPFVR